MRIEILKKLLFALITKHCMDLADESPTFKGLDESPLGQQVKELIGLNRRLVALSTGEKRAQWGSITATKLLTEYNETLRKL